jgi:nitronate monooxygenase
VIRNSTLTSWELAGRPSPGNRPGEGDVIAKRNGSPIVRYSDVQPTRLTNGDVEAMAMYAGTLVNQVRQIAPANAITTRIARDIR